MHKCDGYFKLKLNFQVLRQHNAKNIIDAKEFIGLTLYTEQNKERRMLRQELFCMNQRENSHP